MKMFFLISVVIILVWWMLRRPTPSDPGRSYVR